MKILQKWTQGKSFEFIFQMLPNFRAGPVVIIMKKRQKLKTNFVSTLQTLLSKPLIQNHFHEMILFFSKCESQTLGKKQFCMSNSKNIPRKIKILVGKETRGLGQQSDQRLFCLFIVLHLERQRKRSNALFRIWSKFA